MTYEFRLWTASHFSDMEPIIAALNAARLLKPKPGVLSIVDPRLQSINVRACTVKAVSELKRVGPTLWAYEVKLLEFKKAPAELGTIEGGPLAAEKANVQGQIADAEEAGKGLQAQLKAKGA